MVGLLNLSAVASDSAGIVEMVNGLAYGKSVSSLSFNGTGFAQTQSHLSHIIIVQIGPIFAISVYT